MMSPSEPRPIKPIRYDATVNISTGVITFTRNDESGKLSKEEVDKYYSKMHIRADKTATETVADLEYAFDSGYKHGFMDAKDMISKEIEKRCLEHLGEVPLWLSIRNIKPEDKKDE